MAVLSHCAKPALLQLKRKVKVCLQRSFILQFLFNGSCLYSIREFHSSVPIQRFLSVFYPTRLLLMKVTLTTTFWSTQQQRNHTLVSAIKASAL
ncbi:hypothetical protein JTE90_017433 [Oedothorax gibbosus]|uniref:Uncharacterized protein n=1 Tax=Oedothorax gibbosus TaxID=931172 RepID=A0AAV6TT68_9ARAC|nr:hypothetical protein JTE90_017433 [Oedothorax gibbosus]